jgi:hypothetical protein
MLQRSLRYPALILTVLILAGFACNLPGSEPTATPPPPAGPDVPPGDEPGAPEQPPGPPTETSHRPQKPRW